MASPSRILLRRSICILELFYCINSPPDNSYYAPRLWGRRSLIYLSPPWLTPSTLTTLGLRCGSARNSSVIGMGTGGAAGNHSSLRLFTPYASSCGDPGLHDVTHSRPGMIDTHRVFTVQMDPVDIFTRSAGPSPPGLESNVDDAEKDGLI